MNKCPQRPGRSAAPLLTYHGAAERRPRAGPAEKASKCPAPHQCHCPHRGEGQSCPGAPPPSREGAFDSANSQNSLEAVLRLATECTVSKGQPPAA